MSPVAIAAALVLAVLLVPIRADVIDRDSEPIPALVDLVEPFDAVGVDVLYSHDSEAGEAGPSFGDRPRIAPLLGFKGWSGGSLDMERYAIWLDAFESGARAALAAAPTEEENKRPVLEAFERIWKDADPGERIMITFDESDLEIAERIAGVLEASGYAVYLAIATPEREPLDPELLGGLFVLADHCLVIDTASARSNRIVQFEADLLGELRRQQAWVASGDEGLPPIKRGSMDVIESLGVLPIKILPGGIVLGMPAELDGELAGAAHAVNGSDYGIEADGRLLVLEQVSVETMDAIEAFVAIDDSHSVVDIAGGEVTLASPFQDTQIGSRLARADRMPFKRLSIDGAQKSLIVDRDIQLRRRGERLAADVTLEARFYRQDGDGHAERLATIRFTVQDATGSARLLEVTWSRRPEARIGFDGSGTDKLVDDLEQCALDAALIAVGRLNTASEQGTEGLRD